MSKSLSRTLVFSCSDKLRSMWKYRRDNRLTTLVYPNRFAFSDSRERLSNRHLSARYSGIVRPISGERLNFTEPQTRIYDAQVWGARSFGTYTYH